ncbi:hypothetical protein D043_1475A, partial [Vibrio parahaemolyticus EKP-021]
MGGGGGGQ